MAVRNCWEVVALNSRRLLVTSIVSPPGGREVQDCFEQSDWNVEMDCMLYPWHVGEQPRSQGTLSTSRKYPLCGWSRVYVYKWNPHRGWVFDLILSILSMEVKVALLLYLEISEILPDRCFSPFYLNFYEYEMLIEREVCLFSLLF